ncbi:MAG TPA: glutamine amidotransferase [Steroidobacteraceae bacterium]|nr:glutamine amidotransferase [Steroidobacteraceae bacterium]
MSARLAIAIRHVAFEDCGTLESVLGQRGFSVRYVEAPHENLRDIDASSPDLLVGLGGPISVYDSAQYPWITDELSLFERRLASGRPTLGICLGAQMLAHVLGARVFPGPVKELGWKPLRLSPAGADSAIAPLAPELTSMLHWHGDTFDLPSGATLLASTAEVPQQVFEWGGRVLGFQCHPEIRAQTIEAWLVGHACELVSTAGVSPGELRVQTRELAPALARQASAAFGNWLDRMGL